MKKEVSAQRCYQIIFEALASGKGVQAITDAVFAYTKMPIHAVDATFQVIAASYEGTFGSKHIDDMIRLKIVPSEVVILDYHRLGYIEKAEAGEKSTVVDWGVVEIPQASGAIRVNGIVEGMCATTFSEPSMEQVALEVNDMLCQAIAIEMERSRLILAREGDTIHQLKSRQIFSDFFDDVEKQEGATLPLKPNYQFLVISLDVESQIRFTQAKKDILRCLPGAYHVFSGDYLYVMVDSLNVDDVTALSDLTDVLQTHSCRVGVGSSFSDITRRKAFRQGAQMALEIGQLLHPDKQLYHYSDYFIEITAYYAATGLKEASYHLPELERLRDVDKEKDTDYYHTLKTYLVLDGSTKLTAKHLHIHRNTLIYRLDKIAGIMGIDIRDRNHTRCVLTAMIIRHLDYAKRGRIDPLVPKEKDFWLNDLE